MSDSTPRRAWTCVLLHSTPQSASALELLVCGGHGLVGQADFAPDVVVDGGLGTFKLGHVGLVLALGHVGAVSKAEALVNSVDETRKRPA